MYVTTAQVKVRALDAANGEERWTFDPFRSERAGRTRGVCRGLAHWDDGQRRRIFACARERLYSIDAESGRPDSEFGERGSIDLRENLDRDMTGLSLQHTSPVVVHGDLVITGGGGGEGPARQAPGHIRAWDARTGKRRWIFHTVPHPGEFGYETWPENAYRRVGGTNDWSGMSIDRERGILYASTGSPSFDFYGGDRVGQNLFGNCVLALNARTGERIWHFQTVHHDVWDYDLPCPPMLFSGTVNGRRSEAVGQFTKTGLLFLLDRDTGVPLFDVEERPVPGDGVPGEKLWPTQPFPVKPAALSVHGFSPSDGTVRTREAAQEVNRILGEWRSDGIFTPPSLQGTIVRPGFNGGVLWGGSYDPERNLLIVNSSENSNLLRLREAGPDKPYRYEHEGWVRFLDAGGFPAAKAPWGHLTAIRAETGEFAWRVPLGEHEGLPGSGTLCVGGPLATAGGLTFVGSTQDEKFRAFDTDTGELLWQCQLEAGAYANPCSYSLDGKQYVAIAAGGAGKNRTRSGDQFLAFALPM